MIASKSSIDVELRFRQAASAAINAANPRFGPYIDAVANPLDMLKLLDEFRRLDALAELGQAAQADLNACLWHTTTLKGQQAQLHALIGRAMSAMKALHEAATPDEATPDIDAVIPGARYAEFVDAHAALLYDVKRALDGSTKSASHGKEHA